ncbi:MFS transporter [Aquabacterium sp.]|uniref:MFS transporter n=1 Tax=Aquabacterium sp. TaxID=1872578 RepID=UPI002C496281|nr:MFS transporter [Aquabacterium sp.]HSW03195.1 MFS transporter [Aquabacterium sp.]
MSAAHPPLWRQREYMLLWTAQIVSTTGSYAAGVIYPLLVLAITHSPATVGLVSALRITPYLMLSLPVGALIDRWNRRRVMLVCDVGRVIVVGSLAVAWLFDALAMPQIYVVAIVEGTLMVFFNIAETAALPRVVAHAQLPQAAAQNQVGFAGAAIAGPALGTWLFGSLGRGLPFALNAIGFAVSALLIWRLRTPFDPAPARSALNMRADIAEGLRWLWRERLVRDMSMLTGVANCIASAMPLLLIVLAQRQGASEAQIGLIFSAAGVGGVLGALVGGQVRQYLSFGQVIIGTLVLQAVLFPLLGVAGSALGIGLVYGLMQFFAPIYNVVQFSHRIAMIPDGLQGRVNSSFRLIAHGLNPVGSALCGYTIEHAGLFWALALFVLMQAGIALAAALDPAVRQAQPLRHAPTSG